MTRPLCFVLMPFGRKSAASGKIVDFDAVYRELIAPAIENAGLDVLRADEEQAGGIIHKPMFERLILCEYAVADLTTANANVFYELGVRHAVRPASTVVVFAAGEGQLPFDAAPLRALPYALGADGAPLRAAEDRQSLVQRLREGRQGATDSPVYQLVEGFPDIQHMKTDVFRDRVAYSEAMKGRLVDARRQGADAVRAVEGELRPVADAEAAVVVDLFLSYRAVSAWEDMIALVGKMAPPLAATVMVQEQLGLALNRAGRGEEAERVLLALIGNRGPSSETYGLLGRVYKDRFARARQSDAPPVAQGLLDRALDAYLSGFEADWRDAYTGVNVLTLMELHDPPDPRGAELLPIVAYAVERRIALGKADYWDQATRLELAILRGDEDAALRSLTDALAIVREPWEAETTARNISLLRDVRRRRGQSTLRLDAIVRRLTEACRATPS